MSSLPMNGIRIAAVVGVWGAAYDPVLCLPALVWIVWVISRRLRGIGPSE